MSTDDRPATPPRTSELRTRFVIGPALLLAIAAIYTVDSTWLAEHGRRGVLSAGVLGLLGIGGVLEFCAMLRKAGLAVGGRLLTVATAALVAQAYLVDWSRLDGALVALVATTIGLLFAVACASLGRASMAHGVEAQGATLLGFVWIGWASYFAAGLALLHLPALLFVVLVSKGGDIGAYLTGVAVGRHKLIPHVSGGKTIEGSAGGLVFAVALAVSLHGVLLDGAVALGLTGAVLVGIMLNVTTQVGDLIESIVKRRCGVKDSSHLLPAHGGLLDLTDSLLFSFPAFFLVLISLTP